MELLRATIMSLWIVFHDLAFEDPDFDADDAICSHAFGVSVVDVRTQCVKRNATFTVPFGPRDFRAAQDGQQR